MRNRSLIFGILAVSLAIGLVVCGWWLGKHSSRNGETPATVPALRQTIAEQERRIADLERELKSSLRTAAEQRQLLRPQTLNETVRSVDELLALFPAPFPQGDWSPAETTFEDCWFEASDGIRLHGWYLNCPNPKAHLLYIHGNAGNVTLAAPVAIQLRDRLGVSVLMFDYRGYGRSEGTPTIEGLPRDARAVRDYLAIREGVAPESVVLLGRSLGGAVAVQLAAEDGARGLVLESTFSSLREVAATHYPQLLVNLLVAERLDSAALISRYRGPLLQSHGDADRTIPLPLGRALFDAANEPKSFVLIPGGDHNDPQSEVYWRALERFIAALPGE